MYAGQVVESCAATALHEAQHPYTRGLLASIPRIAGGRAVLPVLSRDPAWPRRLARRRHAVIEGRDLRVTFGAGRARVPA